MAKLLIVDDEPHIRLLIEQTLEPLADEGALILTADNGRDALRIIEEEQPDLVFLDLMMPVMDGLDVCRAVRNDPGLAQVYIAMLTAKGEEKDRRLGVEAGADTYLTKPFDPDALLDLAANIVARRAA